MADDPTYCPACGTSEQVFADLRALEEQLLDYQERGQRPPAELRDQSFNAMNAAQRRRDCKRPHEQAAPTSAPEEPTDGEEPTSGAEPAQQSASLPDGTASGEAPDAAGERSTDGSTGEPPSPSGSSGDGAGTDAEPASANASGGAAGQSAAEPGADQAGGSPAHEGAGDPASSPAPAGGEASAG